jgi:hypothetical protein
MLANTASKRSTAKVSSASRRRSPWTRTVIVRLVCPGAKVRVPEEQDSEFAVIHARHEVELAVLVEVADDQGNWKIRGGGPSLLERAVSVAQQHTDGAVTEVRCDQI